METSLNLDESIVSDFFEKNEFFIIYQKKVDINNPDKVVGVESYLRLRSDFLEPYSPAIFMPVVERMGLTPDLTIRLITKLVNDWNTMQIMEIQHKVSINIDTHDLENTQLIANLLDIIDNSSMPATMLAIDIGINEGVNLEAVKASTDLLHAKGISLSIDVSADCELTQRDLKILNIDEIKLPRSSLNDSAFISKYTKIASHLGSTVTAVGVEKASEQEFLKEQGVNWAQGYLYGQSIEIQQYQEIDQVIQPGFKKDENNVSIALLETNFHYGRLLRKALPDSYDLISVHNPDDFIDEVNDSNAEIVVIEINKNDDSGFTLIKKLTENDDRELSIIYVADIISYDQLLMSYDNHGFAFIEKSKPVFEFIATINKAISIQKSRKRLLVQSDQSSQLAMQSIRDASQYGDILQLMKSVTLSKNEAEIAKQFFKYMKLQNLSASISFCKDNDLIFFCSNHATCSPTEKNVFEVLRTKGRLYEFGERIFVNGTYASFMIKNMPSDEDLKGQIRDYIAVIIECIDARHQGILQNRAIGQSVNELLAISQDAISTVENAGEKKKAMIDYLNTEIGLSFHVLDLSIEQEEYLKSMVSNLISEHEWEDDNNHSIADRLESTIKKLSSLFQETVEEPEQEEILVEDDDDDDVLF